MNKIITFHDVRDIVWFEQTIILLKGKYRLIDIKELEEFYFKGKELENSCHIAIDDGDKTFYDIIYPVLKKHNVPGTLFVSPKICKNSENFWFQEIAGSNEVQIKQIISLYFNININLLKDKQFDLILKNFKIDDIWSIIHSYKNLLDIEYREPQNMTIDQISKIDQEGLVVIGAHTLNHPILANENSERCKSEIIDSICDLEYFLGHEVKYFAYPNGIPSIDFGMREMEFLKERNIRLAFSTESNNFTKGDNPLSIPRFCISYGKPYFVKAKLLLGKYWDIIKNFKSKGEIQQRIELKEKMQIK